MKPSKKANHQADGHGTPWPIALAEFVRTRLRAEVGPDHAPVTPDDPPLRVAIAYGNHLAETQLVATLAEITDRTGITDAEVLSMGGWIWDQFVESLDLVGEHDTETCEGEEGPSCYAARRSARGEEGEVLS